MTAAKSNFEGEGKQHRRSDSTWFSRFSQVFLAMAAIIGTIYGFVVFIDGRINKAIHDEEFMREIASRVRPYVIFDDSNSILVDGGAMALLEEIKVTGRKPGSVEPTDVSIVITPKKYLGIAPLLELLDGEAYIEATRGEGFEWVYHVGMASWLATPMRYRVEVIQ